ncbi:hypothetical protein BH09VER1_BH09VER1_09470 [soil metagenome]
MKQPLYLLLGAALGWLLIGALVDVLVDAKLLWPAFLDGEAWLTYGRLRPAADNAMLFGWASQAGLAVALWLLARLGGSEPRWPGLMMSSVVLWNAGVLVGVGGILVGRQGPTPGLEFPGNAAVILTLAFVLFAVCALFLLLDRTNRPLFVSQWYLLAALLCFPWLYLTGNTLLVWQPIPGSAQLVIAGWYQASLFWLWLVPLGLAILYYVTPTVTRRSIHAYPSSVFAFRALVVLGGWTGLAPFLGGPIPAWLVSASLAAGMVMLIPITIVEVNLLGTLRAALWSKSPVLSFVFFSLVCLGIATLHGAATAFTAPLASFTGYAASVETLRLFAFASMAIFAAIYLILSLASGREVSPSRVRLHYVLSAGSITLMFLSEALSFGEVGSVFLRYLHFLSGLGFLAACVLFAWIFLTHFLAPRPPAVQP